MRAEDIHDAISAVCPIDGVSIGQLVDKETWRVDYAEGATEAQRAAAADVIAALDLAAPEPVLVLPQHLMALFTASDVGTIQAAIAGDAAKALLWYSLLAQRDPMRITTARFLAGWSALVSILGAPRMAEIAAALGVEVEV